MIKTILDEFDSHLQTIKMVQDKCPQQLEQIANIVVNALQNGNKILLFGNGGSASDAQHIAAEFTGRYKVERGGLPAIALTTDTSILTACANDYSFDYIFARQIEALGNEGDIFIAISTSGKSKNIIEAIKTAKNKGLKVFGLTGKDGGEMKDLCDCIIVKSEDTAIIQEVHEFILHFIARNLE
jgi:D-sedoheptulose 7-phosphate isomerase